MISHGDSLAIRRPIDGRVEIVSLVDGNELVIVSLDWKTALTLCADILDASMAGLKRSTVDGYAAVLNGDFIHRPLLR